MTEPLPDTRLTAEYDELNVRVKLTFIPRPETTAVSFLVRRGSEERWRPLSGGVYLPATAMMTVFDYVAPINIGSTYKTVEFYTSNDQMFCDCAQPATASITPTPPKFWSLKRKSA